MCTEDIALPDLLERRKTNFVLWRPAQSETAPKLVIGQYQSGVQHSLANEMIFDLEMDASFPDLWQKKASDCGLIEGEVYHYFFEVTDSNPYRGAGRQIRCTDPTAWTVDWRLLSPLLEPPYIEDDRDPASVVLWDGGELKPCDPGEPAMSWEELELLKWLPTNERLVIYELPLLWTKFGVHEVVTFRDLLSLIDYCNYEPSNFVASFHNFDEHAYVQELGVNALELLSPADSFDDRSWGDVTSNYFAADFDLGLFSGPDTPTASRDLFDLIRTCHCKGIRFFYDAIMAFSRNDAYQNINYLAFHVHRDQGDPEQDARDALGGDLFKYNWWTEGYDPISGQKRTLVPARQLMKAHIARWLLDFHVDGLRLDSVNNIMNYQFVQEVKDQAHTWWKARWQAQGNEPAIAHTRFCVIGEELNMPPALLKQNRLDGLWNERFKQILRQVILGKNADFEQSFERSVRMLIDCRLVDFRDGTQAVNYVTSRNVQGFRNERLCNYLVSNGVSDPGKRIKLAFVCLLTAVGIPMILAGEEFADEHDKPQVYPTKLTASVNFSRLEDPWRGEILNYVKRLVRLRTTYDALAVDDTEFLHVDFTEGKRVVVWQRGHQGSRSLVVVVANFSEWGTLDPNDSLSEYLIPNWPATPRRMRWREITQNRLVPPNWVGRELLYPWEAKVYCLEELDGPGPMPDSP